ncbi:hypothetical protein OESDEN_19428 [Oesophagostomum dentatum]|uniref:Uncharacterized protein n=1 Tax=Oesophagostomum dentatum TaxID=61180 RepID=A0A0B1SBF4_OESDE|nr:hypothetical protein OESDEN_19428 [Oesophagostomum dentatum]
MRLLGQKPVLPVFSKVLLLRKVQYPSNWKPSSR